MNDFTKKELIFMRDSFLYRIGDNNLLRRENYKDLDIKIQEAIDAFPDCDHAWVEFYDDPGRFSEITGLICIKCHEVDGE